MLAERIEGRGLAPPSPGAHHYGCPAAVKAEVAGRAAAHHTRASLGPSSGRLIAAPLSGRAVSTKFSTKSLSFFSIRAGKVVRAVLTSTQGREGGNKREEPRGAEDGTRAVYRVKSMWGGKGKGLPSHSVVYYLD